MTEASNDLMAPFPELVAYREGMARGEFLVPRCRSCGKTHWYPRSFCPFCYSGDVEPVHTNGSGTIYSYTVVGPVGKQAVMAYVTLSEGPRMLTSIVDCDPASVHIDMPVQACVRSAGNGDQAVVFRPIEF